MKDLQQAPPRVRDAYDDHAATCSVRMRCLPLKRKVFEHLQSVTPCDQPWVTVRTETARDCVQIDVNVLTGETHFTSPGSLSIRQYLHLQRCVSP